MAPGTIINCGLMKASYPAFISFAIIVISNQSISSGGPDVMKFIAAFLPEILKMALASVI